MSNERYNKPRRRSLQILFFVAGFVTVLSLIMLPARVQAVNASSSAIGVYDEHGALGRLRGFTNNFFLQLLNQE